MRVHYSDDSVTLHHGDTLEVLRTMPDGSVNCCVTSPPYFGLRDYGIDGQYGREASPAEYVETMRKVFAEVRRVLADDGTLWLNIGDSYTHEARPRSEPPSKNMLGIPWRVAFALQDDGWILRNDVIWNKPNAMPESVTDRLSTRHEHVFMFAKSRRYRFDLDPVRENLLHPSATKRGIKFGGDKASGYGGARYTGNEYTTDPSKGRNPGDVWTIPTQPFPEAHFAVFPSALADRCIKAGCRPGGVVLDPFSGSGTTGMVATRLGRRYVGIDINRDYLDLSLRTRLAQTAMFDAGVGESR